MCSLKLKMCYTAFTLLTLSLSSVSNTYANTPCDAILQNGIYDHYNVLDQQTKFEVVKNAHCKSTAKSSSKSLGLGVVDLFSAKGDAAEKEGERGRTEYPQEFRKQ